MNAVDVRTRRRSPFTPAERVAVGIVAAACVGFAVYGVIADVRSTFVYVASVVLIAGLIGWVRTTPLPGALVIALALDATAHMAGGLINVGDDVLYNGSIGPRVHALHTHVLQYDHLVHATGSMLATLTLWVLLARPLVNGTRIGPLLALCVLGGLGIGAINETIEYIATISHHAAHIGGYDNTGWDLISNTVGASIAAVVIRRSGLASAPVP
jgi:hypothetical protein